LPSMKIMPLQPFCKLTRESVRQSQVQMAEHLSTEEPGDSSGPNARTEVFTANFEFLGISQLQWTPRSKCSWNALIVPGISIRS
jgi:hypothetical protein